jgi:hypothetical protein
LVEEDLALGAGKTCFIVSPIGSKLEPQGSSGRGRYEESIFMWENVFEPACKIFGLVPVRADKISNSGEIPDQIFTYLRDADVVIADVSHANPNVMYELGLRHTRPGITIQVGEYNRLPFDVTTIRTLQFSRTEAGLIGARDDLIESLRADLKGGNSPLRVTKLWGELPVAPRARIAADAEVSAVLDEEWDDAPGTMDILAEGERAIGHIAEVMVSATSLLSDIGTTMVEQTASIKESDANKGGFAGRIQIARVVNEQLAGPAGEFEGFANEYYDDTLALGEMVSFVVTRLESEDENDERESLITLVTSFLGLVEASEEGAVQTATFRESVRGLRKFSRDLRPAIQVLERGTSRFLEGHNTIISWREKLESVRG